MVFVEVKRNPAKIKLSELKKKSEKLLPEFKRYKIQYLGLSLNDM